MMLTLTETDTDTIMVMDMAMMVMEDMLVVITTVKKNLSGKILSKDLGEINKIRFLYLL